MKFRDLAKNSIGCYFLLTIPLAWVFWIPMIAVARGSLLGVSGALRTSPIMIVLSTLGGLSPLISRVIVGKVFGNPFSLDGIFKEMRIRNTSMAWLVASVFVIPLATIVGMMASFAAGNEAELRFLQKGPDELGWWLVLIIPIHFATALFTSPLFEEPGWRGFALPELQKRFPREISSLILASYWWLWHQGMNVSFGEYPSLFGYISMVAVSFVIDSLYNLSNRNLLAAMFAHQASGTSLIFLRGGDRNFFIVAAMMTVVAILRIIEYKQGNRGRLEGADVR